MISLCKKCKAQLLEEIAELPQGEISGFFCRHNNAAAVIVSNAGKVVYAQLSGPCSEEQAQALIAETAGELLRGAAARLPTQGAEAMH